MFKYLIVFLVILSSGLPTYATFGRGEVLINGQEMAPDVNRDIRQTQEVLTDKETGGLDLHAKVNTEALTNTAAYTQESKDNVTDVSKNLVKASGRIQDGLGDLGDAAGAAFTTGANPFQDYQTSTKYRQATLDFQAARPDLAKVINHTPDNQKKDSAAYQSALASYTGYVQSQMGTGPVKTHLYDSNQLTDNQKKDANGTTKEGFGFTSATNKSINLNIAKTDLTNTDQTVAVAGHENAHAAGGDEAQAKRAETQATKAWESENRFNGNVVGGSNGIQPTQASTDFYEQNRNSVVVMNGTQAAAGAQNVDPALSVTFLGKTKTLFDAGPDVNLNLDKALKTVDDLSTVVLTMGAPGAVAGGLGKESVTGVKAVGKGVEFLWDSTKTLRAVETAEKVLPEVKPSVSKSPDFYVKPDGTAVPGTGYRAIGGDGVDAAKNENNIMSSYPQGTYITFDNISNKGAGEIKSLLQLEKSPRIVAQFDTLQILDNLKIPRSHWGEGPGLEPLVNSLPEFGKGGGTQAVLHTPPIQNFTLKELESGR